MQFIRELETERVVVKVWACVLHLRCRCLKNLEDSLYSAYLVPALLV